MTTADATIEIPPMLTFEQWKQKTEEYDKAQQQTYNINYRVTDYDTVQFFRKKCKIKGFAPGPVFIDGEGKHRECMTIKLRIAGLNEFFNKYGSSLWLYTLVVYPSELSYGYVEDWAAENLNYIEHDELKIMEDMVLIRGAWDTQK